MSVRMDLRRIAPYAARHHGVVTFAAASRLGVTQASWYRAIDSGLIEGLAPGVARLWGSPPTRAQRILAAVCASGVGAVASHRSAAWLWGVARPEGDPIDVSMLGRNRGPSPAGVVVHRPRDLLDLNPVSRNGVPTTTAIRMLIDLGAVDRKGVAPALEFVLTSKGATFGEIRSVLERHARQGRHGVVALRDALDTRSLGELPSDSVLEERFADLARRFRLPPMEFHAVVEGYEVDFRVTDSMVIIECDGHESHGLDREQFEFDRIRNGMLVAAGYAIVHVTWREVTRNPAAVAKRIEAVVRRWAPDVLTRWQSA